MSHALQRDFAAAAREFHVPRSVLLAVSYHETLWESHQGEPSVTGNYNVMGLTQLDASQLIAPAAAARMREVDLRGKGGPSRGKPDAAALAGLASVPAGPAAHTLSAAARLIGRPGSALRDDMRQSVRGGAALLASYERAAVGALPGDPGRWYAAVARYSQSPDAAGARLFADRVYATIRSGASRITADGQQVTLTATASVTPQRTQLSSLGLPAATSTAGTTPECPPGLACNFVAAAYQRTSSTDPTAYGNYDHANRPADGDAISHIVIHDSEGTYNGTIAAFQNPSTGASAHYVISSAGQVTQMVLTKDVAWHAGNWYMNMHAIGIEHEGFALQGATWYLESEYESSAALVRYLAAKYAIPLDRQHLIGHDDVPGPLQRYVSGMHWDPGTYWNWNHYLDLVGAPPGGTGSGPIVGGEITIAPPFTSANEPTVTGCGSNGTSTCPPQPANFVYLRTGPGTTYPLIHDTVLHPSATAGTTAASDWTDKAVAGQSYIVAAPPQGPWTAIWYEGQKAWFYNPGGQNAVANGNTAQGVIMPKAGATSIPVYGRAYPSPSSYPTVLQSVSQQPDQQVTPLNYTIPAGQAYLVAGPEVPGTYFYTENYDQSAPGDHTLVTDTGTMYYPIRYNHRIAFVLAGDVQAVPVAAPPPSTYMPDGPVRIMDTRYGTGVAKQPVGAGATISLQVTGRGGVPSSGVTAVVMNVTATTPTAASYVTVYPDGQPRPATSSLDFSTGETIPNLVIVPVVDGKVDFYNLAGSVQLIADITGYYTG